jgi:hypothetical protein
MKAIPGRKDETEVTITNDPGNISFKCIPESPTSLDELVQLMARAKRENRKVKAAGSLHAGS